MNGALVTIVVFFVDITIAESKDIKEQGRDIKFYWSYKNESCPGLGDAMQYSVNAIENAKGVTLQTKNDEVLFVPENFYVIDQSSSDMLQRFYNRQLPQNVNHKEIVEAAEVGIKLLRKKWKSNFSNLAILEMQTPLDVVWFIENSTETRNASVVYHVNSPLAREQFNNGAVNVLKTVLKTFKKAWPNAQWGLYGWTAVLGKCGEDADIKYKCAENIQKYQDRLLDMLETFNETITLFVPMELSQRAVEKEEEDLLWTQAQLEESKRLQAKSKNPVSIVVITPLVNKEKLLSPKEICVSLKQPLDNGVSAIILRVPKHYLVTVNRSCETITKFVTGKFSENFNKIVEGMNNCSQKRCTGNGRCQVQSIISGSCDNNNILQDQSECACEENWKGRSCEKINMLSHQRLYTWVLWAALVFIMI